MRVYLPATLPLLGLLVEGGLLPTAGFAVTSTVRAAAGRGAAEEEEALEYAAFLAAASASVDLVAADPQAPRRRVVVAAEAASVTERPEYGPSAVVVTTPVRLPDVAAVHADDPDAEPLVAAASGAGAGAGAGADELADVPLLWWARQEIADLLG